MAISKWTAIGCAATSLTALVISTRLLPFHQSYHEHRASPTHRDSFAISVITPQQHHGIHHHGIQENYSLLIPANRFPSTVSDEEILARFTKGFFSGLAFTPERWLLSASRLKLTDTPAIKTALAIRSRSSFVVDPAIWNPLSISLKSTPSFASLLFGNFLTLDSSSLTHAQRDQLPDDYIRHPKPSHAFVEFAWGGEGISLVGSHRFEVSRHEVKHGAEVKEFVKITFSCVACKPKTGLAPSSYIQWLHVLYSRLLFSDGIKGVLTE